MRGLPRPLHDLADDLRRVCHAPCRLLHAPEPRLLPALPPGVLVEHPANLSGVGAEVPLGRVTVPAAVVLLPGSVCQREREKEKAKLFLSYCGLTLNCIIRPSSFFLPKMFFQNLFSRAKIHHVVHV